MLINGVELELDLLDADVVEKFEKECQRVAERIQDNTAYEGKSNAECIRYQCSIVNDFFDSVCGKGTSEKLFGGKCNLGKSMEAFAIITTEARNDDKINDITNKYMPTPNRAERRNQKYKGKKRNSSKIHPYTPNERLV